MDAPNSMRPSQENGRASLPWNPLASESRAAPADQSIRIYTNGKRTNVVRPRCAMVIANERRNFIMRGHTKDGVDQVSDYADDAVSQISRLREQVETLMRERVAPAVGNATERMGAAAQDAQDAVRERADALAGQVRDRPLTSILIAAALGYLIGRVGR